ncbi:SHPS1 phosphatase, partial [Asarcornis scutulata]|nr:SHPS1 phosphatase [Asarcornis scutulata]
DTQVVQGFELHQPQKEVFVRVGETLTLSCTVTEGGLTGPVKWLKGWGTGSETIYDQRDPSTWEKRAVNESNTDFTILIRDVRPEDNGTYYCVKFRKATTGDEFYQRGDGTEVVVVVQGDVEVATAVLFFLLLIFILIFCVYHKKCRGEGQSQGAGGAPAGGCSPISIPCCAGSPGTPRLQSSEQKDIHYADLQPLREAPQRSQSPGADRSEYASIRAAAK